MNNVSQVYHVIDTKKKSLKKAFIDEVLKTHSYTFMNHFPNTMNQRTE